MRRASLLARLRSAFAIRPERVALSLRAAKPFAVIARLNFMRATNGEIRLPAVAALLLLATACSQPNPTAAVSPGTTPTVETATSPSSPPAPSPPAANSPAPVADLPLTTVDLNCRLPVVTQVGGGDFVTFQGGFLALPAATLTTDPRGKIQSRYFEQDLATFATPVLFGTGYPPFYDRGRSRWLPVAAAQALPDGSGYAYATFDTTAGINTIHVVTVASGNARTFRVTATGRLDVADYSASGVFLVEQSGIGGPGERVRVLNPSTGAVSEPRLVHRVWAVRSGFAWVARFDPRDTTSWAPSELQPANTLVRVDLATGAETVWFYRAGSYPWWLGFDSNARPIVWFGRPDGTRELRWLTLPGQPGSLIYSGGLNLFSLEGDRDRLWFGSDLGIYLYRPVTGLQKVFAYSADPSTAPSIHPAGFCL